MPHRKLFVFFLSHFYAFVALKQHHSPNPALNGVLPKFGK